MSGTEAVSFVRGFSEGWIEQVGTKREHRGSGLAAALIQAAMRAFALDGNEYATLEVDTENSTNPHGLNTRLVFNRTNGCGDHTQAVEQQPN